MPIELCRGIVSSLNKSRGYRMRSNGAAAKKHVLNDREGGREKGERGRGSRRMHLNLIRKGGKRRRGGEEGERRWLSCFHCERNLTWNGQPAAAR